MTITIHHLNKNKKKIGIKKLDLTKYIKFGSTGNGMYFQPKKGKGFEALGEEIFDSYKEQQDLHDEAVKNKCYRYDSIDENLSDSIQNRKRDNKGKPIRIYEKDKDLYKEYNINKLWFIDDENWNKLLVYIKKSGIPYLFYFNNEWIED